MKAITIEAFISFERNNKSNLKSLEIYLFFRLAYVQSHA
jgi:hypothetical protein